MTIPLFFFFNDTATTEIYTLSLHDALPIWPRLLADDDPMDVRYLLPRQDHGEGGGRYGRQDLVLRGGRQCIRRRFATDRKEHTSELQSRQYLVCRLLLEKQQISHGPLAQ